MLRYVMLMASVMMLSFPVLAAQKDTAAAESGCIRNENRGFSCSFNMGAALPQTDADVEALAKSCFQNLQDSCNNMQGGTSCRWTARFTCKKIIDQARAQKNTQP